MSPTRGLRSRGRPRRIASLLLGLIPRAIDAFGIPNMCRSSPSLASLTASISGGVGIDVIRTPLRSSSTSRAVDTRSGTLSTEEGRTHRHGRILRRARHDKLVRVYAEPVTASSKDEVAKVAGEDNEIKAVREARITATGETTDAEVVSKPPITTGIAIARARYLQRNTKPEVQELHKKLKRFSTLRMWRQALTELEQAEMKKLPLQSSTYTLVMSVLNKGARHKEAITLLEKLISRGAAGGKPVVVSLACYNAAISACARANRSELCVTLLRDMRSRIGLGPDLYTYGAVISGLAKGGRSKNALEILREIRDAGLEPDWVCLKAAMDACENRGSSQEAGQVLRQMTEAQPPLAPSLLVLGLTSAIGACIKNGEWKQAVRYLDDIRPLREGKLPPAPAYAAAAYACAKAGELDRARSLVNEIANEGGRGGNDKPSMECYDALIHAASVAGDADAAVRILRKEVPAAGLKVTTKCVNRAIMGCARGMNSEMALELLQELRRGKFSEARADRESFNAALDACGRSGRVKEAIDVLDTMAREARSNPHLRLNQASYASAILACKAGGDSDTALALLERMKVEDRLKPEQRGVLAAVAACNEAGRGDEVADLLESLVSSGVGVSEGARASVREDCRTRGAGNEWLERAEAALDALDAMAAKKARPETDAGEAGDALKADRED